MRPTSVFDLEVPVIFINPPSNRDFRLIEEVSSVGGLGIVDKAACGKMPFQVPSTVRHGIRISLNDLQAVPASSPFAAAIIRFEDTDKLPKLKNDELSNVPFPVIFEVGSARQAVLAEKAGASALIARGNEGPGWVGDRNGFVLLQEIISKCTLPTFLRGGVDIRTAVGAIAAGAAGVCLDVHLMLTDSSALDPCLKEFLGKLALPATTTLCERFCSPLRVYSRVGTKAVRDFKKIEENLPESEFESHADQLDQALRVASVELDTAKALFPLSEDIVTAQRLTRAFGNASKIVAEFGLRMKVSIGKWPFGSDSELCKYHSTRFPVVQGPMAHVSDNVDFLKSVAEAGALPFLALGNMPASIVEQSVKEAGARTKGLFGVGLIGLEVNRHCYEAHLEIIKANPPRFAILAAGDTALAKRIEEYGIVCYLHCPSPALLKNAFENGLRHFVFEGNESGGHIGALGSLDLWNANLIEIEAGNFRWYRRPRNFRPFCGRYSLGQRSGIRSRYDFRPGGKGSQGRAADRYILPCYFRSDFHTRHNTFVPRPHNRQR